MSTPPRLPLLVTNGRVWLGWTAIERLCIVGCLPLTDRITTEHGPPGPRSVSGSGRSVGRYVATVGCAPPQAARLILAKTGESGERLIPLPSWAVTMLKRRRLAIASQVQPVFPDSLGGWRDPSNVRRVWRQVRDKAGITGLVSHTLRKTVASFLDDAAVPTRKISDQLGHSRVSMTQSHYIGRKLTDRQTADVLEELLGCDNA